jgi:signal transduction histidine kinase
MQSSTYKILNSNKMINIQCSVFEGSHKIYGLISVSDVTNLQKFEKQRVAVKFKTMYLSTIAHDLRTPLNTIMSMNEHVMNFYKGDKMI